MKKNGRMRRLTAAVCAMALMLACAAQASAGYYRFYREQLTDQEKLIYDSIEQNMDEFLDKGALELPAGTDVSDVKESDTTAKLSYAFYLDHPDVLGLNSSFLISIQTETQGGYDSSGNFVASKWVTLEKPRIDFSQLTGMPNTYYDDQTYKVNWNKINAHRQAIDDAIASIDFGDGSDYSKVKAAYEWLAKNNSYSQMVRDIADKYASKYGIMIPPGTPAMPWSAASCFLPEESPCCQGYTRAFKLICDRLGIPCVIVAGTPKGVSSQNSTHEWNYVKLDGKWYACDLTSDDVNGKNGKEVVFNNFLRGKSFLEKYTVDTKYSGLFLRSEPFGVPKLADSDYRMDR